MTFKNRILHIAGALLPVLAAISCNKDSLPLYEDTIYEERKVLILYSAGHNGLSSYLTEDIEELIANTELHTTDENADALLIFTHSRNGDAIPRLLYPHLNKYGNVVVDTLVTYDSETISASAQTFNTVLTYIKDNFPADEYGLIFSSHGTGYLPSGYYDSSSAYERSYSTTTSNARQRAMGIYRDPVAVPAHYPENPIVKSIGSDYVSSTETYEMEIADFADAIPMKLEYIVFDACLMGGIETAYQLRDKTHWMIASPTEILADGMDYTTISSYLMAHPQGDFEGVCKAYYDHYNALSGASQSATISLIDCSQLDQLATECASIFSNYRDAMENINYSDVQRYYTSSYHWFYDLGDIIDHLGCTDEELEAFNGALDACISYKAATGNFLSTFAITAYSGLSMMLPKRAGDYLKAFYTTLDWNIATALVE